MFQLQITSLVVTIFLSTSYPVNQLRSTHDLLVTSFSINQVIPIRDSISQKQINAKKYVYGGSGSIIAKIRLDSNNDYYKRDPICFNVIVDCVYKDKPTAKKAIRKALIDKINSSSYYYSDTPINYEIDECVVE